MPGPRALGMGRKWCKDKSLVFDGFIASMGALVDVTAGSIHGGHILVLPSLELWSRYGPGTGVRFCGP